METSQNTRQRNATEGLRVKLTRRNFLRGMGLMSATAALAACGQAGQAGQSAGSAAGSASSTSGGPLLAIIHTNDVHGHDVEVAGTDDAQGNFSLAAVPALKAEWEAKGYDVVLVDAGDATQGMPLVDSSNGSAAVAFMNSCGYDLMTVGNHEFDWGAEALDANIADSNFPWLSANVIDDASGGPRFATNKIIELSDGTKVGFFGLTTPSTLTTTRPSNIVGLTFLQNNDLHHCAQAQVDELRDKGCELVVCVGHLGNDSIAQKDGSKDVLEAVSGIDLFIDGHDHDEVDEEINGTPLVETGCYLHNIGVVAIDAGAPTPELLAAGSYDGIDGATQAIIDSENARVEEELSVVVASTPFLLDAERAHVRMQETNLGDLVTDALRWSAEQELAVKPDAAIVNGGAIRQSIPEGDISLKTIKTVMPFSNVFVLLELTGAQLLEALEASCQGIGQDKELGAFPQVSGIRFAIDASVPFEEGPTYPGSTFASPARPGARITIEDVGGRVFSEEDVYQVATSDYLCQGGDTYRVFKDAADAKQPTPFGIDYEVISSFLIVACDHEVPADYAQPQDRITIVGL